MKPRLTIAVALVVTAILLNACGPQRKLEAGDENLRKGRVEAALGEYIDAVRITAGREEMQDIHVTAMWRAGETLAFYMNRHQDALPYFKKAIAKTKDPVERTKRIEVLARTLFGTMKDYESAIEQYQKLLQDAKGKSRSDRYRYRITQCLFRLHKWSQLRNEVQQFVQDVPDGEFNHEMNLMVAQSMLAEGSYKVAITKLEEILSAPEYKEKQEFLARAWFEMGNAQVSLKLLDDAQQSYANSLEHHPNPASVQVKLATLRHMTALKNAAEGGKN